MRVIVWFLIIMWSTLAKAEPTALQGIRYLVDPKGQLNLDVALASSEWQKTSSSTINLGFHQDTFWFRADLPPCTGQSKIFEIAYPLLDQIDLWLQSGNGKLTHYHTGDLLPFEQRVIEATTFAFPYQCGIHTHVVIKVRTNSSVQMPINVWEETAFYLHRSQVESAQMLYFGAILVMAIYNLFIYFSVRNAAYLSYVLFALSCAALQAGITGIGFRYLWPSLPVINDHIIDKSLIGIVAFGLFFAMKFMKSRTCFPRADRAGIWLLRLLAVYSLMSLFIPYSLSIRFLFVMAVVSIGDTVAILIRSVQLRMREGYFYAIAWTAFILSSCGVIFSKLGWISAAGLAENSMLIGNVLEMLLLSFALADQTNVLRRNLGEANKKLADTLQSIEQIVAEKTQSIRSIMETMKQGIMTIKGKELLIQPEYSHYARTLLGPTQLEGREFTEVFLDRLDLGGDQKQEILSTLGCTMDEDAINFELNSSHLPLEVNLRNGSELKELVVDWTPIANDQRQVERVLISFRDVTELNRLKKNKEEQSIMMVRLQQLLNADPKTLQNFFQRALPLLEKQCQYTSEDLADPDELRKTFVVIHTLKGESRSTGLRDISEACHAVEDTLQHVQKGLDAQELVRSLFELRQVAIAYDEIYKEKIGRIFADDNVISDHRTMVRWQSRLTSLTVVRQEDKLALGEVLREIHDLMYTSTESYRQKIQRWAKSLAKETDVAEPQIVFHGSVQYLGKEAVNLLDQCLVHLIQNALAHSLETSSERLDQGKAPQGLINIHMTAENDRVLVHVRDDGRGLNLEAIAKRAVSKGMMEADVPLTNERIHEILFSDGFSSANQINKVAGRGIGMSAIMQFVSEAGGRVYLDIGERKGVFAPVTFVMDLDISLFPNLASHYSQAAS